MSRAVPSLRTVTFLPVAFLFLGGLAPRLFAECLGCPAGAQRVEVYLDAGSSVHGFVIIHRSLVKDVIDKKSLPIDVARQVWIDGKVRVWDRVVTYRQPFVATEFMRRGYPDKPEPLEELGVYPGNLPDESVMLIGEPREIPLERILRIEDRSVPEGHFKQQTPVYHVSELNGRFLIARPRVVAIVHDRLEVEDRMYTCLSYLEEMPPKELARKCVDELDKVEEGIVKLLSPGST